MVVGHEEREEVPLHLVRDLCDHHVAIAYQTPGDIEIPVTVNWEGDLCNGTREEGVQLFDAVATLTVHQKILRY